MRAYLVDHPEALTLSIYGSMAREQSRPDSDVDAYLLVNAEKTQNEGDEPTTRTIDRPFGSPIVRLAEPAEKQYHESIRGALKTELKLEDNQVEHVRVLPISREIVDWSLNNLRTQIQEYKAAREQNERETENVSQPWKPGEQLGKTDYVNVRLPMPSRNVTALFHPGVGTGAQEYRDYVLDQLASLGEEGEEMWHWIVEEVRYWESPKTTEEGGQKFDKTYPQTIAEARATYASAS